MARMVQCIKLGREAEGLDDRAGHQQRDDEHGDVGVDDRPDARRDRAGTERVARRGSKRTHVPDATG